MTILETTLIIAVLLCMLFIHRQKRQIQALRYCLINMSDFSIRTIKENIESTQESVNAAYQTIPGDDKSFERTNMFINSSIMVSPSEWERIIDKHKEIMKHNGMKKLNESDYEFPLK